MADESEKKPGNPMPTEGFPVAYVNLASVSASFNDVRVYLADQFPKTVVTMPGAPAQVPTDSNIAPRICIAMGPEFAKSLCDALSTTLSLYEKQFGPLRPTPKIPGSDPR